MPLFSQSSSLSAHHHSLSWSAPMRTALGAGMENSGVFSSWDEEWWSGGVWGGTGRVGWGWRRERLECVGFSVCSKWGALLGRAVSKPQVLADCWSDISVPCYVGHVTQIDTLDGLFLPEGYHPRESQRWQSSYSFCNLILGVMSNHFCCILFIKSQSLNLAHIKGRGYIKLGIRRGRDHLE